MGAAPELVQTIARLARIRADLPALRHGDYGQLVVQHEQLAFAREFEGQRVVVMLNASDRTARLRVPIEGVWSDVLEGGELVSAEGWLGAEVRPFGARILVGR